MERTESGRAPTLRWDRVFHRRWAHQSPGVSARAGFNRWGTTVNICRESLHYFSVLRTAARREPPRRGGKDRDARAEQLAVLCELCAAGISAIGNRPATLPGRHEP